MTIWIILVVLAILTLVGIVPAAVLAWSIIGVFIAGILLALLDL